MARITLASQAITIAALEARISVATVVFKAQRATIREMEAKLNTRGCIATPASVANAQPTVTNYRDAAGQLWERTRYSASRSISRMVDEPAFA